MMKSVNVFGGMSVILFDIFIMFGVFGEDELF